MSKRGDFKQIFEAYSSIDGGSISPPNMLGGKPVMITMDIPGASFDNIEQDLQPQENDSSEIEMALSELHKIIEYAPKLKDIVKRMPGLEGWISSKITKASDYMSSVYHWLEFKETGENEECCDGEMFQVGYEDTDSCGYAEQGCKCHGCPECC